MTVREKIAETIRAYMMQLPPIADKPRRMELVIEYPSVTERHEIIKEIEKMTTFEDTKAETETAESLKTSGDRTTLAGGNGAKLAGGYGATLAGGDYAKLTGGNYAKLAGGYGATLAGGDCAKLAGGNGAKLAGGYGAKLTGGNYAKLAGGYGATLAGDNYATLAGGYDAKLAGGNDALIVGDKGSVAKGGIGSVILLVSRDGDRNITAYKAIKIDGKRYKADVYYTLGADGEVKAAAGGEPDAGRNRL